MISVRDFGPLIDLLSDLRWRFTGLVLLGLVASLLDGAVVSLVILLIVSLIGGVQSGNGIIGRAFDLVGGIANGGPGIIILIVVIAVVLRALVNAANESFSVSAKYLFYTRLRVAIFRNYVRMPYARFVSADRGSLFNTMNAETWNVAEAFQCAIRICINLAPVMVFGAIILVSNWAIGLAVGVAGVAGLLSLMLVRVPLNKLARGARAANEQLSDKAYHAILGMRTIRIHGKSEQIADELETLAETASSSLVSVSRLSAVFAPIGDLTFLAVLGVALGVGAVQATPSASLLLIVAALFRLQPYLMRLQGDVGRLYGMEEAVSTVSRALADRVEMNHDVVNPFVCERELRFDGVTFAHAPDKPPIIDNISFKVAKGDVLAVCGPSGVGKSTLANLLMRLLEPSGGAIYVDGINVAKIDALDWLKNVTLSGQDTELLDGTILDNFRMRSPNVTEEQIHEALTVALADGIISSLPDQLQTKVGERGVRFSGGQRQRLVLAMTIAKKPKILILDEATNAVDAKTEAEIFHRLRKFLPRAIFIIIAHRSEAIEFANASITLFEGAPPETSKTATRFDDTARSS